MAHDQELDRLLEEFDRASRRLDTRTSMIEEALIELTTAESVQLDGYMGFGRTLRINDDVRAALVLSGKEEVTELQKAVEKARDAVMGRRTALALS